MYNEKCNVLVEVLGVTLVLGRCKVYACIQDAFCFGNHFDWDIDGFLVTNIGSKKVYLNGL